MSIFRIATKQALREIIEDHATQGRFGVVLSDESLEMATERIVDLFEMTLTLRSHTASMLGGGSPSPAPASAPTHAQTQKAQPQKIQTQSTLTRRHSFEVDEHSPVPKTKNAAEIYDKTTNRKSENPDTVPLAATFSFKLPRTRIGLSEKERQKLTRD